ncbi:hypothetical protein WN55_07927 [Dufourea novaeangliae]|uniref:Uncharacterized protein n=1 Tax=Dufourea novaeangliae TaxID=178035 RepID=A0A154P617_DUFNO|nr:hypothetical protein WN55_07927 [Dufourea novaeangliae]
MSNCPDLQLIVLKHIMYDLAQKQEMQLGVFFAHPYIMVFKYSNNNLDVFKTGTYRFIDHMTQH